MKPRMHTDGHGYDLEIALLSNSLIRVHPCASVVPFRECDCPAVWNDLPGSAERISFVPRHVATRSQTRRPGACHGCGGRRSREALHAPSNAPPLRPKRTLLHRLTPLISVTLFIAAGVMIWHEMRAHALSEVIDALRSVPTHRIVYAFLLTIAGYIGLIFYDYLAFLYVRHPLPLRRIAMGSFIAYGFSNALGHPVFTGGSLRYRVYSAWGVSAGEAATIIIFCLLSFKIGMIVLCGAVMLYEPDEVMHLTKLPHWAVMTIADGLLTFRRCTWSGRCCTRPIRIRRFEVRLPSLSLARADRHRLGRHGLRRRGALRAAAPAAAHEFPGFLGAVPDCGHRRQHQHGARRPGRV